ncbi:MAG: hypothetical protein ABIR70_05955 [Bryobacteraceae bacterium]
MNRFLLALALVVPAFAADPPQIEISNAATKIKLYVPDAATGYYRATRFDWAGAMASVEWGGHNYFGKWFDKYDPSIHDSITGPVEEFGELGYKEAAVGESFVKIGVGALQKPSDAPYDKFHTYDIADAGRWIVITAPDHVEFRHILTNTNGYAYEYRKNVYLINNGFALEHTLRNNGTKPIKTDVYDHNFFMLDGKPTGPDVSIRLPFAPKATADLKGLAEFNDKKITFLKEFGPRDTLLTDITGFALNDFADYEIYIENKATGAGVRQASDHGMSKLALWSIRNTVCPEAYIDVNVEPGKQMHWIIAYQFYNVPK